jgi:hypothetical protein
MGMRGSSFIRRHSFPRRFSSKNSLRSYVSEMVRGISISRTYGSSSKEDGTFSESDGGGGGASELDMVHADGDKHYKKL